MQNIIDGICAARVEAQRRGIEANMVAINDGLFFSKIKTDYNDVPIICGLKTMYSAELPDNILFAVAKGNNLPQTKNEQIANLQAENERLQKALEVWKDIAHRETGYVKLAEAEAHKEFAEKLKEEIVNDIHFNEVEKNYLWIMINNRLKKLLGE